MPQLILGICWLFYPLTWVFNKVFSCSQSRDVASTHFSDDGYSFVREQEELDDLRFDPYSRYDPTDSELLGHPWK